MSWGPGAQIDRYLVEGRLGAGGMGVVWRARDLETGAPYAIKTLPTRADADLLERFRREGLAQARADGHPNVVRIHSSGTAHGHHYLVMALAEGGDLSERLRAGPLAPERVREIGIQLAGGLEWLHQAGVLHRDLKPANVLLSEEGRPVLVDYGLVKSHVLPALPEDTKPGFLCGTPHYMSNQRLTGAPAFPSDDAYAFALMLVELLTGRLPRGARGRSVLDLAETRSRGLEVPILRCPSVVRRLIQRGLSPQRENRPTLWDFVTLLS